MVGSGRCTSCKMMMLSIFVVYIKEIASVGDAVGVAVGAGGDGVGSGPGRLNMPRGVGVG